MIEAENRIREALADEALHDEGASVSDTLDAVHVFEEVCSPENIAALLAEIDRLRAAVQHEADCVEAAKACIAELEIENGESAEDILQLIRERDEARAERDALRAERDTLKIGIDSVLHALARADVSDVDDPGDAIDLLAADAKRYDYILDCEFIAARKYLPNLDEHEFKAKRIAHHDAQIEQERSEQAKEG